MLDGVSNIGARFPLGVEDVVAAVANANTLASVHLKTRAVLLSVPRVELIASRSTEGVLVGLHEFVNCEFVRGVTIAGSFVGIVGHLDQLDLYHGFENRSQGDVAGHLKGGAGSHFVAVLVDPVGELVVEPRSDRDALDHCHGAVSILVAVDRSRQAELRISGRDLIRDGVGVAAPAGVELDAIIDRSAHVERLPIAAGGLRVPAQEGVGVVRDLLHDAGLFVQLSLVKDRARIHGEVGALAIGGLGVNLHLHLRGDPLGIDGEVAGRHRTCEHLIGRRRAGLILEPSAERVAGANGHIAACVCA